MEQDLSRAQWKKSSYSGNSGNCVEIADLGDVVAVRDSHDKDGPRLILTLGAWRALVRHIKSGSKPSSSLPMR